MLNKKSSTPIIEWTLYSLFFFLLCLNLIPHLNLWGDEAASFHLASLSMKNILANVDVHSPNYYFFLKWILTLTGSAYSDEATIRLVHATIFLGGLYFGYQILSMILERDWVKVSFCFVLLLPTTIFYATNIRMYALLYCFSMWFIYAILQYLGQGEPVSLKKNGNILISGILLLAVDYVGFLYYALGVLFILLRTPKWNQAKLWLFILFPFLVFLIEGLFFLTPIIVPSLQAFFIWPFTSSPIVHEHSMIFVLKWIFSASRPFLELSDISSPHLYFILAYLFFLGILLVVGTLCLIKKFLAEKDWRLLFLLAIAYFWTILFFSGTSITRIFLPSQLCMVALIFYGLSHLPIQKKWQWMMACGLLVVPFFMALFPAPRLLSQIPYQQIATDILNDARQAKIDTILISGYSENYKAITHYLSQNPHLPIVIKKLDVDFGQKDLPTKRFLFLSYMGENNRFVDAARFSDEFHKKVSVMHTYLKLTDLPFNAIWKKNILSRSHQEYAYVIYQVWPTKHA